MADLRRQGWFRLGRKVAEAREEQTVAYGGQAADKQCKDEVRRDVSRPRSSDPGSVVDKAIEKGGDVSHIQEQQQLKNSTREEAAQKNRGNVDSEPAQDKIKPAPGGHGQKNGANDRSFRIGRRIDHKPDELDPDNLSAK